MDGHVAEPQLVMGPEMPDVLHLAERAPRGCGGERRRRHVDRQAVFAMQDAGVTDMVGMVVRDDHGIYGTDVPAVGGQAFFRLHSGDAGVE